MVILCKLDPIQVNLQIQWFTLFFEILMFVCIYIGSPWMQKFSAVSYGLRMLFIIFWGGYLMLTSDYKIGEEVGENSHLVSLYFAIFITTRELVLLPCVLLKAYFSKRYDQLAISELKRLKAALKRKFQRKPGCMILGMERRAFFASLDPGIFNWDADEVAVACEDPAAADPCREAADLFYKQGGAKPLRHGDDGERILECDSSIYSLTFVCLLDSVRGRKDLGTEDLSKHLDDYFFKASMIYFIQMLLIGFVFE